MSVPAQPSEPAFRFVAAAILSRHQQGSQATNATGRPAAWQIVKQRACSGYFGRTTALQHLLIRHLEIQGTHCRQYCFSQVRSNVPTQHTFIVLASLLSHSWPHGCLDPSVKIFVEGNLCSFQIAAKVAFAQLPCQICLRFPHGAVDGSVVVVAFIGFMIAAEINPDEPSAVASCDDLANFASHRVSSLARKRGTQSKHYRDLKPLAFRLIE